MIINGEQFVIVSNIVQLITNYFVAEAHIQIDRKQKLMETNKSRVLPNHEEILLNRISESIPDYMKEHQPKEGPPDLNNMLYRRVKKWYASIQHTSYAPILATTTLLEMMYQTYH